MQLILTLALLTPLVFLVPRRAKVWFTLALVGAGAAVALSAAGRLLAGGEFTSGEALQWEFHTLFGPQYVSLDTLSAVFVIIICIGALAVTLYSRGYIAAVGGEKPGPHISLHYMCLGLLFFSMLGVVTSHGGYAFLICWELMTVSSFALILFDAHKRETRRAAMSYLVMMHVGFVFLLVGFVTLQAKGLSVSFEALGAYFSLYAPLPLLLLFLVGFGMKAGLFPLHSWLPEAHPAAPAHISAFMSGVMIKMGIYGILRVVSFMQTDLLWAGVILFVLGIVTAVWGVLSAAVQNDMKRMLAWSSIENVGIVFLAVGVALIGRATHSTMLTLCAMGGALLHTFNHSMFKTLLFFGTGNVYTATHTTSLDELGGVAKKMPVTAALFLAGVSAICALPPLSGFVSEFLIYYGLMDTVAAGGGGVMISLAGLLALSFTGGVAIVAFTKLYGVVFLGVPRSGVVASARETDVLRGVASAIPLAGILLVGLFPMLVMRTVFTAAGIVSATGGAGQLYGLVDRDIWMLACTGGIFTGATLLVYLLKKWALGARPVTASPTWGCGYGAPSARMQYTGESYSEGLQSIAPQLSGTADPGSAVGGNEIFPRQRRFSVKRPDTVASAFNARWVELLRQINRRVMAMRTGKVNYHILYALLFLLLILILSICSVI